MPQSGMKDVLDNFFGYLAKPVVASAALEQKRRGRGVMIVGPFGGPHDPVKGVPFKFATLDEMRAADMSWETIESAERYDLTRECLVLLDCGSFPNGEPFAKLLKITVESGQVIPPVNN